MGSSSPPPPPPPPPSSPSSSSSPSFEETITTQYKEKVIELAKQNSYVILIQDVTTAGGRETIQDPFSSSNINNNNNKRKKSKNKMKKNVIILYTDWEEKEFKRYKITKADYEESKKLSAKYEETDDDNPEKIDNIVELYQFLASRYLKMSNTEFMRADWGTLRIVLDACQFRTTHSLADLSKSLYEYFHIGKAHLNQDEYEIVQTYRLWTGKAKTKPWEINGGIVYEEDINTVLKMEELDLSGQNYRAKKESAKRGGGEVGADGDVHRRTTRYKNR